MGIRNILHLIREMLAVHHMTPDELNTLQQQRLRRILNHAKNHSPFYREIYDGIDVNTCKLEDLPVVTKPMMMEHFNRFLTVPGLDRKDITEWLSKKENMGKLYQNRYIPLQTSGSTGENALILYTPEAMDVVHAAFVARHALRKEPTGLEQLKHLLSSLLVEKGRMAILVMTGGPYPAYSASFFTPYFRRLFIKTEIIPLFDPVDRMVEKLNHLQPENLFAYPSVLDILAREQLAGRLHLKFTKELSAITTGGEPLSDTTRELAMRAWNMPIQDTYGSAECLVMARMCGEFYRMHVMSDLCILEIVDGDYRPVPDGELGEKVLVTNLFNTLQPFIRYELTDVTGYSLKKCSCNLPFPILKRVEGRTDDIFYIARPEGGTEPVHPTLFLGPIVELDEVRAYQLIQTTHRDITFRYVPEFSKENVREKIVNVLERGLKDAHLDGRVTLHLEEVEHIDRHERSGKFKQIVSLVGPEE